MNVGLIPMVNAVTFKSCGLDPKSSFLLAPICECGCGNYMDVILNEKQDLYNFMGTMLAEHECNYCAIFALCRDTVEVAIKVDDKIKIYGAEATGDKAMQMIAEMQEEAQFHCYGLLVQIDTNLYEIVME